MHKLEDFFVKSPPTKITFIFHSYIYGLHHLPAKTRACRSTPPNNVGFVRSSPISTWPHGSHAASREWSMDPHEPYWQTNTSFSPPPSRWDLDFQPEGPQYGFNDGIQLYGSSTSSNRKESKSWVRGNQLYHQPYSDGAGMFLSSSSQLSQGPQWTPPAIQEICVDEFEFPKRRGLALGPSSSRPIMEGTSENPDSWGSVSFRSDSCESEPTMKLCLSSHLNFSSHFSFMSKPIHPLSYTTQVSSRQVSDFCVAGMPKFDAVSERDTRRWSSASSSIDLADLPELFESQMYYRSANLSDSFRCGLCEKFLSQRSPLGSHRIARSRDMAVTGVLSCHHVFNVECLEQATPKMCKNDPPCPLCFKAEEEKLTEQHFLRLKTGFPRLRPSCEDGPRQHWGCVQVGDCVEGALHAPPWNTMLLLNRNLIKKNLILKGNSSKEFPGKIRRSGSYSSQQSSGKSVDQG